MINDRLVNDCARETAMEVVRVFSNLLYRHEVKAAYDECVEVIRSGMLSYAVRYERLCDRLNGRTKENPPIPTDRVEEPRCPDPGRGNCCGD